MADLMELRDGEFEERVIAAPMPVLVEFWAPWCGPCRKFAPALGSVTQRFKGRLRRLRVNTDENEDIPRSCDVQSIPTLILFANGTEVVRIVGKKSEEELGAILEEAL